MHAALDDRIGTTSPRSRVDRFALSRAASLTALAVVVAASFGPWLRSGEKVRSSYELFRVVDRLGFLGDGAIRWLPRIWVAVPLLAAVAAALFLAGRHRLAAAASVVVGAAALVVGTALQFAPLPAEWGSRLGAAGGAVAVVGSAVTFVTSPPSRGATDR